MHICITLRNRQGQQWNTMYVIFMSAKNVVRNRNRFSIRISFSNDCVRNSTTEGDAAYNARIYIIQTIQICSPYYYYIENAIYTGAY